jgi:hypothetical protein
MRPPVLLGLIGFLTLTARPAASQERSRSPHGPLNVECTACHRSDGWTPVRISRQFDHARLGFPLAGAHATAACRACHQTLDFKGTPSTCTACHQDIHRGELGADCAKCHTPRSFLDRAAMTRAHQLTRFPLEGAHLTADCSACHTPAAQGGQQFVSRQTTCFGCHQGDYAGARDPDHTAGGFPHECAQCHAPTLWSRARFNHDASGFPLSGAHRAVACAQCHVNNRFAGINAQCVGCHQQDYASAQQPSHTQPQFPTDCTVCHTTTVWRPASFDHGRTQFPLTGMHLSATCDQCHNNGVYQGKLTSCESCHVKDYNTAANPNHAQLGWPQTCITCHSGSGNTTAWNAGVRLPTQYHSMFSVSHQGARGDCTQCHNTTNFVQSTCSNHHHPPTCTYLNRNGCGG